MLYQKHVFNSAEYFMQQEHEQKYMAMMQEATEEQLKEHYNDIQLNRFDSGPYYQQVSIAKKKTDAEIDCTLPKMK